MTREIVRVSQIVILKTPVEVILLRGPLEGPGPKAISETDPGYSYAI